MTILILTGNVAFEIVKEYVKPFKDYVKVLKLPISIAAFTTPELVIKHLKGIDLSPYEVIITPGLMQGSAQPIQDKFNIPTFKGPRYASDIPLILEDPLSLSKKIPADKFLTDRGIEEYNQILKKISEAQPSHPFIEVNSLRAGKWPL